MTKEEKFYNALRDVFIKTKVEGESGYINLMRIKACYYEKGVFPKLQQDINETLKPFSTFRDELCEKLYDFSHDISARAARSTTVIRRCTRTSMRKCTPTTRT